MISILGLSLSLLLHTSQSHALPSAYQGLSASAKLKTLWSEGILKSEYQELPEMKSPGLSEIASLLSVAFLEKSFDRQADEMPSGRRKILHPLGTVAIIEYVPLSGVPYDGVLKDGTAGLARLSLAGDPDILGSYTPGMAVKFLQDGEPSLNLHVMKSLSGQGQNQNFFKETFSNILPEAPFYLRFLALAFAHVKNPPTELEVSHIAPVYQILFKPNHEYNIDPNTQEDFRVELSRIPKNSRLYDVFVRRTKSSNLEQVGSLFTRSRFIASKYGDEKLFFQHHRESK